tara:strand:+ start:168 stop:506 length:339 start_codon:yes stop_codon:yes gene_type:complete
MSAYPVVVRSPTLVKAVIPNPFKLAIDSCVVVKDPTALVDDKADKVTLVIFEIVNEPTEDVADTPVTSVTGFDVIEILPTVVCADKPVIPITSAGVMLPTALVADKAGRPIE